jgi:hypothetical protein
MAANQFNTSTENSTPKARRQPHCKTCGSPMLGHKKGSCPQPRCLSENPLEDVLEKLNIKDIVDKDKDPRRSSRRVSQPVRQLSLDSLSSSSSDILSHLLTPPKEGKAHTSSTNSHSTSEKQSGGIIVSPKPVRPCILA